MPELKRNFLKGKMNKDLDERLVPAGEYRDALNVEISTSEGSDVGSVQNTKGNYLAETSLSSTSISTSAEAVGSYVHSETGKIYNFIRLASDLVADTSYTDYADFNKPRYTGYKSDMITEFTPSETLETGTTNSVLCDVYEARLVPAAFTGQTITNLPADMPLYLREGMRVQAIDVNGVDLWGDNDVRVVKAQWPTYTNTTTGVVEITPVIGNAIGYSAIFDSNMINDGVTLRFTAKRSLNFIAGTKEIEDNNIKSDGSLANGTDPQNTPNNNLITAINIIDDLLYFTDGRTEPKKINITQGIAGGGKTTAKAKYHHTRLIISKDGVTRNKFHHQESHITVIKPAPMSPPSVTGLTSNTQGVSVSNVTNLDGQQFRLSPDALTVYAVGDIINVRPAVDVDQLGWSLGDTITLTGLTSSSVATFSYQGINTNVVNGVSVKVVNIPSSYSANTAPEVWTAAFQEKELLYPDKFVSFAYRYKYQDNEYSVISPYSKPLFVPGAYAYNPEQGVNYGMENKVKIVNVKDFIPQSIPKDVVEVELMYRETNSPNVYTIRSFNINEEEWNVSGNYPNRGSITIKEDIFGSSIPSNQLLRTQDLVPTSAVAQEITESRLMYGNYTENYDLTSIEGGSKIVPNIESNIVNSDNQPLTTFESDSTFEAHQTATYSANTDGTWENGLNSKSIIPFDQEISDPSSVYDNTNYSFTAPVDGYYYFEASAWWKAVNAIQATASGTKYMWVFPSAKIELRSFNGNSLGSVITSGTISRQDEKPAQFDGASLNGEGNPHATSSNNTTWWISPDTATDPSPAWPRQRLSLEQEEVYLSAGDKVVAYINAQDASNDSIIPSSFTVANSNSIFTSGSWHYNKHTADVKYGAFKCTHAPTVTNTIYSYNGVESVKSIRNYQVGVVYRDGFGRQSTVMIDKGTSLFNPKSNSEKANKIETTIRHEAPYWAESYKFFIKETTDVFYNLLVTETFNNNDGLHWWLAFNSDDINKVSVGDFLIAKKNKNSNISNQPLQKWKILDISEGVPTDGSTNATPIIANESDVTGKFFVKIAQDIYYTASFGDTEITSGSNNPVVETQPKNNIDLDLYYEVGKAYPIKLDKSNASEYIIPGMDIKLHSIVGGTQSQVNTITSVFGNSTNKVVTSVGGASTFSKKQIYGQPSFTSFCSIKTRYSINEDLNLYNANEDFSEVKVLLKFINKDGSYVTGQLAYGGNGSKYFKIIPITHPTTDFPDVSCPISLPWYNCVAFGNGVESDRIKDDYNSNSVFTYAASGKQSGFNASTVFEDYKREFKSSDIIFSQIYNEKGGINGFNQFIIADDIVKQLSPDYGSIQKMFTRNNDVITFCENKVLQIFANKDELFNAGGNSQLLSSNKVLGRANPFKADFGISKNPESFAVDEYRIYFTDKSRGAVLRLSADGITEISGYGLGDWFGDRLQYSQALVGSFDSSKDEYNLTLHELTKPGYKKNVYTLSYSEDVKGWSSFKSFIKEQGVTLDDNYYTFKNGKIWRHHSDNSNRNTFYNDHYNSSITPVVNDFASSVKSFSTISYEGTQSKVDQNTQDGSYNNLLAKSGWYVESIITDQQNGSVAEFIEKEGKWFNNILGEATTFSNAIDNGVASGNIDTHELSVQGIGVASSISGTTSGFGHKLSVSILNNVNWSSLGYNEYNITSKTNATTNTFVIEPDAGFSLKAEDFTNFGDATHYSSINFTDQGVAGTPSNTILATITWKAITLTSDITISLDMATYTSSANTYSYEIPLVIDRTSSKEDVVISSLILDSSTNNQSYIDSGASFTVTEDSASQYKVTVSGSTVQNVAVNLFSVKLTAIQNFYYFGQGPTVTINSLAQGVLSIVSEVVERDVNDLIKSKTVVYQYNPAEDISLEDNYSTTFGTPTWQPIKGYASFLQSNVVFDNTAQSVIVLFNTNIGHHGFQATSSDDTNFDISEVGTNHLKIDLAANSGSARNATIKLFGNQNPGYPSGTPNDTIVVHQTAASYIDVTTMDGATSLTITPSVQEFPVINIGGTYYKQGQLKLQTNGSAITLSNIADNQATFIIDNVVTTDIENIFVANYRFAVNETGSDIVATVTLTHSDTSTTDTIAITQKSYVAGTNTSVFNVDFLDIANSGASGTLQITSQAVTNDLAPLVTIVDTNDEEVTWAEVSNLIAVSGQSYTHTVDYAISNNVSLEPRSMTFNVYHPYNLLPGSSPSDLIAVNQSAIPYAEFNPTTAVNSTVTIPQAGSTDFVIPVSHNDYVIGGTQPTTLFKVFNTSSSAYDLDFLTTTDVTWVSNRTWDADGGGNLGSGELEFDVQANTSGSDKSIIIGVFHSDNTSSTPNDTITLKSLAN